MMNFRHLHWDSSFFGINIGRVDCPTGVSFHELKKELDKHIGFRLIYIFSPEKINIPENEKTIKLVDEKIGYQIKMEDREFKFSMPVHCSLEIFNNKSTSPELESLAYQSGEFSRFKTDKNFDNKDFFRLYKEWIDKSISGEIADSILIAKVGNNIAGLLTLKYNIDHAKIGLFAVDEKFRGLGAGIALINFCKEQSLNNGLKTIFVDTQAKNLKACSFYEKNGFKQDTLVNVYHYWNNKT